MTKTSEARRSHLLELVLEGPIASGNWGGSSLRGRDLATGLGKLLEVLWDFLRG